MAAATTIRTRKLTKRYEDVTVVDDLDLEVAAGEVFGLLGPNGAGKTTTILMLLGLVEPSGGEMRVLGLDPRLHPLEVKQRVGYLPDAVGFYDNMTGRENLRFTARLNGVEDVEDRIDTLLDQVGLTAASDQPTGEYSRGMKQRLGLADALVKQPSVLILDEPTTAIDPEGVASMLALIRSLATDEGVTILLSSHLLNQVQAVCDRVAIFVAGKVVAHGTPHQLAASQAGAAKVEFRYGGGDGRLLERAAGVESVTAGRVPGSWLAVMDAGRVPDVVGELVAQGAALTGVHRIDEDLDAIYRRYFDTREEATS